MNNSYKVLASSLVVKCLALEIGSDGLEIVVGAGIKAARHTLHWLGLHVMNKGTGTENG